MRWSIGYKLGLLLASFSVLATLALGYLSFDTARSMLVERAEQTALRTARVLAVQLQTGFDNVGREAIMLAHLAQSQGDRLAQAQGRQVLADAFAAVLQARPAYLQLRYIGLQNHGLEQVRVYKGPAGQAERTPDAQLQEKAHLPMVFETARLPAGRVYLSDLGTDSEARQAEAERAVYSAAAPVWVDGAVVGVVVLRIDATVFLSRVSAGLPEPYGFYLANRWGDYLVHPDRSKAFGFERGQRVQVQEEFAATAALLDGSLTEKMFVHQGAHADERVLAFVRLPLGGAGDGRFLLMGLAEPMAAVQAQVQELARTTVLLVAVLALAALLLALWVSRVVTRPLRQVAQAAEALSQGRPHAALPVGRQDEFGELARSFGEMEEKIEQQMVELNRSRDAMAHLAHHDALTGLPNRRMFEQKLSEALERAHRSQRPCALVFVDLDGFKSVNDQFGHAMGDAVLQAAAQAIEGAVRQVDTVARLAGDEFTVLCENVDTEDDADCVLDKLRQAFAQPLLVQGHPMTVRASMGVSLFPRDGGDARTLMASADAAMYRSKEQRTTW